MKNTKIEWAHHTVNPWWGCTKVSEACENCYAEGVAKRFGKDCFGNSPRWLRLANAAKEIKKLNATAKKRGVIESVFINSMSDFFDERVIPEIRLYCWDVMRDAENLVFLVLTKRADVMLNHLGLYDKDIPQNVRFGITAENQKRLDERMGFLERSWRKFFISMEPILEPIDIIPYATQIDWVICGGESGNKAREFDERWAVAMCKQCFNARIPFFYKQDGANFVPFKTEGMIFDSCYSTTHSLNCRNVKQFPAWHPKGGVA